MKIYFIVAICIVANVACSSVRESPDSLAGACQMSPCECVDAAAAFWQAKEKKPIEWSASGEASCPEGYSLRRTDMPKRPAPY